MCPARGPRTELGPRGQHPPLRRGRVRVPTSGLTAPATRYPLPTPTTGAQAPGEGPRLPLPTLGLMGTPGDPEPPEPHAGGSRGRDGKRGRSHHAVLTGAARAGGRGRVASRGDTTLGAGPENAAERAPRPCGPPPQPTAQSPRDTGPGCGLGDHGLRPRPGPPAGLRRPGLADPGRGRRAEDRARRGPAAGPWAARTWVWTRACVRATRPQSGGGRRRRAAGRLWLVPGRPAFRAPPSGPRRRSVPRNPSLSPLVFMSPII